MFWIGVAIVIIVSVLCLEDVVNKEDNINNHKSNKKPSIPAMFETYMSNAEKIANLCIKHGIKFSDVKDYEICREIGYGCFYTEFIDDKGQKVRCGIKDILLERYCFYSVGGVKTITDFNDFLFSSGIYGQSVYESFHGWSFGGHNMYKGFEKRFERLYKRLGTIYREEERQKYFSEHLDKNSYLDELKSQK